MFLAIEEVVENLLALGVANLLQDHLLGSLRADPAEVDRLLVRGSYSRPATAPARFQVGARVRTKNIHPASHTRLPRFARGHVGTIERIQGCHVFPDAAVADGVERPEWLYTVTFEASELWGPDADPTVRTSIEAFEPYLEAA